MKFAIRVVCKFHTPREGGYNFCITSIKKITEYEKMVSLKNLVSKNESKKILRFYNIYFSTNIVSLQYIHPTIYKV